LNSSKAKCALIITLGQYLEELAIGLAPRNNISGMICFRKNKK
jgi:hypothetical protein